VNDTFGRVNRAALLAVERAAGNGRRITARRARKQKRKHTRQVQHASRMWVAGAAVAVTVTVAGAGAAIAVGGGDDGASSAGAPSGRENAALTADSNPTSTTVPVLGAADAAGFYIQYADATGTVQYMYCTKVDGCGLVDVAADGTSTIAATQVGGVWHREVRAVLKHDPCVAIGGAPGDLVSVVTTDLRPEGTQRIKGVRVPERIAGTVVTRYDTPEQANCSFTNFTGGTMAVNSPVTEFTPGLQAGG
jgi:hypothetical protein